MMMRMMMMMMMVVVVCWPSERWCVRELCWEYSHSCKAGRTILRQSEAGVRLRSSINRWSGDVTTAVKRQLLTLLTSEFDVDVRQLWVWWQSCWPWLASDILWSVEFRDLWSPSAGRWCRDWRSTVCSLVSRPPGRLETVDPLYEGQFHTYKLYHILCFVNFGNFVLLRFFPKFCSFVFP